MYDQPINENDVVLGAGIGAFRRSDLMEIPIEMFGAVGNGIHDDSDAIEDAANYLTRIGGGILTFKGDSIYVLTRPIYFPENVDLRGNGCQLKYIGSEKTAQNWADRNIGFFNFYGQLVGDPVSVTALKMYNDYRFVDINTFPTDGYVEVADASVFSMGEFIVYDMHSTTGGAYDDSTGGYDATILTPKDHKLLQITKITGNRMFVDYISPYDVSALTWTATIQKVNVCQNIRISDFNLYDEYVVPYAKDPNNNDPFRTPSSTIYVCGFGFQYNANVRIKNLSGLNMKYNLIQTSTISDFTVDDLINNNPAIVGSGSGYAAQFNHAKKVVVRRAFAWEGRHVVDMTDSAFCHVMDSAGYRMYSASFQCHGYYEHDLKYTNVVGNLHTASGTLFGNSVRNITIDNLNGWLGGGNQTGLRVLNSKFRLKNLPIEATFTRCEIKMYLEASNPTAPDERFTKAQRSLMFRDGDTDIISDSNSGAITGFHKIQFSGGKVWRDGNPTAGFILSILDNDTFLFDNGVLLQGIRFRMTGTGTKELVLRGVRIEHSITNSDTYFIEVKNMSAGLVTIRMSDSSFISTRADASQALFLFNDPVNNTSTPIRRIFSNCYFYKAYRIYNGTNALDYFIDNNNIYETCTLLGSMVGTYTPTNVTTIV